MPFKELDWLEYLKKTVKTGRGVITGIGDDCALVRSPGKEFLLKSDLSIEGVHFTQKMPLSVIATRAVGRVLSDFAACGGRPRYLGVSAGIPARMGRRDVNGLLDTILAQGKRYGFSLIGGDTSRSEKLFLDVWGVGFAEKCITRSGASIGDHIFITGPLGMRPFDRVFEPRLKEADDIVRNHTVTAMIDISDGFALDLTRLLDASKKGAVVFYHAIPVTAGESDLYRGEDYELIFTVDKHEQGMDRLKKKYHYVGIVMPRKFGCKLEKDSSIRPLAAKGYLHDAKRSSR